MDKETVMSWLEGLTEPDWRENYSDSEVGTTARNALEMLKEQPEIVQCKDCEFGKETCGNISCHKPGMREYESELHFLDWFCADGKHK